MKKAFLILITLFSCNKQENQKKEPKNDSIVTYKFNKVILNKTRNDIHKLLKKSKEDVVFLGDSQTEGFPVTEVFSNINVKNRGIAGNTTSDILNRLQTVIEGRPKEIFLQVGLNDISQNIELKKINSNFNMICDRILKESPETKLYIQSVLPTTLEYKKLNPEIIRYNKLLQDYCNKNNIVFIDVFKQLLDGKELNKKYTYDGIHLTAEGYVVWIKELKKYIKST